MRFAVGEGVEPSRSSYVFCLSILFPEPSPPRQGGVSAKFHHPTVCKQIYFLIA